MTHDSMAIALSTSAVTILLSTSRVPTKGELVKASSGANFNQDFNNSGESSCPTFQ